MCDICKGINSHLCPVCGDQGEPDTCPECGGECWIYEAYNIESGESFRVPAAEYDELPDDEDTALAAHRNLCKGDINRCPTCEGDGYVTKLDDPDDYFDEDAYMERYYERKYGND